MSNIHLWPDGNVLRLNLALDERWTHSSENR